MLFQFLGASLNKGGWGGQDIFCVTCIKFYKSGGLGGDGSVFLLSLIRC